MEIIKYVKREDWGELTQRPAIDKENLNQSVQNILNNIRDNGDKAIRAYTQQFDNVDLTKFLVTDAEIQNANKLVSKKLMKAINIAKQNIEKFHKSQFIEEQVIETSVGVECWRKSVAIEKVGLYIPGGSAPLFSTVLMLGIPAKLANCKEVILCTPSNDKGEINPAILYTANLIGITKIYKI